MASRVWLLVFVLLESFPIFEGTEMQIQLNANMLTMYRKLANGSNISTAVDGDAGNRAYDSGGWYKCASSTVTTKRVYNWLAIDLKGVFLISTVRISFRRSTGKNATVFVGNSPFAIDGSNDYQCGKRWLTNVKRAPHFHNFTCQPPRWASHVSVQRKSYGNNVIQRVLQICEVEVYYTLYTTVGVNVTFTSVPGFLQTVVLGEPVVCSSMLVSNAAQLLKLQWLYPNRSSVSQNSHVQEANSISLTFNSEAAQMGNYSCSYTLNGRQRSEVVSVSGTEMKILLNPNMLTMYRKLDDRSSVSVVVDKDAGDTVHDYGGWYKCASSAKATKRDYHWLAIDLKEVFLISTVRATFRYESGTNATVFVGNNPSVTDGRDDYQCGDRWLTNVTSAPHFHDFVCQPPRWASHVSVQRNYFGDSVIDRVLQICEVEVYYIDYSTVGVNVSLTSELALDSQTAVLGEPVVCSSMLVSKAAHLLKLQWMFPNGTAVSQDSHVNVTKQYNSISLSFTSIAAQRGNYSCNYMLNGRQRSETVSISAFDCGWSDWSSCSESCGKIGMRERQQRHIVTQSLRSESGCVPPKQQCYDTRCGKLNLTNAGATATQGPRNHATGNSVNASLAIDGAIVTDDTNHLDRLRCAASPSSTSFRAWLRIDLHDVYLISEVVVTFYGTTGRNAEIRVGSRTSSDGNDNLLCGTIDNYSDNGKISKSRTVKCKERLWGRYVNVEGQNTSNLDICEVEIYNELDVGILYNQSNITTVYVNNGDDLPEPLICGVSPDSNRYNEVLNLIWRRDNRTSIPSRTGESNTISQTSDGHKKLYVKNVADKDEGWYECEYTLPGTNQKHAKSVQVLVNVNCGWSEWGNCYGACGVGSRSRSADNPSKRHRGRKCIGPSVKNCTDLPLCPPSITNFATVKEVDERSSLILRCEADIPKLQSAVQTVTFQWRTFAKAGIEILLFNSNDRMIIESHKDPNRSHLFYGTLRLNPVLREDSGRYTCRTNGSLGTSNFSTNGVSVNVKFAPENVTLHKVPKLALKGQSVAFNCTADGNPNPTYSWLKDGKPVGTKQTFSIKSVSYASEGMYVCVANNTIEAGWRTDNASAAMKVEGRPENCSILNAVSYNSSSLTLNVTCFNGNSPIMGYLLQFKINSSSVWKSLNTTSDNNYTVLLRDLKAFTQYDVQIKARNRHGYETGSESFSTVKTVRTAEGKPSPPLSVVIAHLTARSVVISWKPPLQANGNISLYQVFVRQISERKTREDDKSETSHPVKSNESSFTLTSLKPYTTYQAQVMAVNIRTIDNQTLNGQRSNVTTFQTNQSAPEKPSPPPKSSLQVSFDTANFTAPRISTDNGPVKYVDIVVSFKEANGSLRHYTALRYSYEEYKDKIADRTIVLGSGLSKANGDGTSYNNRKLQPVTSYSIYVRVVAEVEGQRLVTVRSQPFNFTTLKESQFTEASSSSESQFPMGAVGGIIAAVVILVGLLIVILLIRHRRSRHDEMKDRSLKQHLSLTAVKQIDDDNLPLAELTAPNDHKPIADSTEILSITACEDMSTLLLSDVVGDPEPQITWSENVKELPGEKSQSLVVGDGALQTEDIQDSDAGTYVCFPENKMGADERKVELVVKKRQEPNQRQSPNTPDDPIKRHVIPKLHAIPIDEFPDYVAALHSNGNAGFDDEFESLAKVGKDLPATAFKANKNSNRYKNIPTYDHSRVVLPIMPGRTESQSDYIAAAFADGYGKPKKYIAAQGPLEHTCIDFWRMIWAEDISTIVMLTALVERTKIKCHQYWPSDDGGVAKYDVFVVAIENTNVYADFTVRTLTVAHEETRRSLYQYHFTAWPDHDVPKFATGLLGFIGRVNRDHEQRKGPIAVHCSAGVGRTGTYIVIDTMLDKSKDGQPVDIYSCVTSLRTRRAQMVQTQSQYMFIHDAVMEAVVCGKTEMPVHNLHNVVEKMSNKDPKSKLSGFENHFKVLQALGPQPDKLSCRAGMQPGVQMKNRYPDIVPFDRSRVILKNRDLSADSNYADTAAGSDYINASFLDGFRRRDAFIVTQSPLKETVNDFWKMIWEQTSNAIVMLTPLEEEGKEMCHQYWPTSEPSLYGSITVEMKEETEDTDYVMRRMMVTKDVQSRMVTQFHYTAWPENGRPRSMAGILDMVDQLQKWQQATGDKVITIHCNNGVGRSGAFCGLLSLIEIIKMETAIDFFNKVKAMRTQRPGMVQTVDQYVFMHEAVVSYLDSFQTYANFK